MSTSIDDLLDQYTAEIKEFASLTAEAFLASADLLKAAVRDKDWEKVISVYIQLEVGAQVMVEDFKVEAEPPKSEAVN